MRSSVKMNCPECKNSILQPFVEPCCNCLDGSEFKPKTNADRIRSMTDEELVFFLWWFADGSGKTKNQWRDWLKQAADKDGEA